MIILSMLICNFVFGQRKNPSIDTFITETILKGMAVNNGITLKKDHGYFYAIAFSFDKNGRIDTMFLSKRLDTEVKKIFALDDSLLKRIKQYDLIYSEFASKIVLMPFYHYNSSDDGVSYQSGFLTSIENLVPESVLGKPLVICKPIVNAHIPRTNN
ncbi:hypothetical protein ACQKCH_18465 [Nubsella zeaxanthinifaciens]|uniref:hypothetical protein n=1 Tax=Nubsella zeaxanthinifaciens TaxID=392412 RepID=UPI003D0251AA